MEARVRTRPTLSSNGRVAAEQKQWSPLWQPRTYCHGSPPCCTQCQQKSVFRRGQSPHPPPGLPFTCLPPLLERHSRIIHAQRVLKEAIAYSAAPAEAGWCQQTSSQPPPAAFQAVFGCSSRFSQPGKLTQGNHEMTKRRFRCLAANSRESSCKVAKVSRCALRIHHLSRRTRSMFCALLGFFFFARGMNKMLHKRVLEGTEDKNNNKHHGNMIKQVNK